jgi:protein required for attachment to host cells
MKNTWVLVADAALARVYEIVAPGEPFTLVQEFENPDGRAKSRDWRGNHEVGDLQQTEGWEHRGAMEPLSIKKVEAQRFARSLSSFLDKGLNGRRYERLILCAPPELLGMLRRELSAPVQRAVYDTIAKDFVRDPDELEHRLSLTHLI